jgi:hypothetical protein
MPFLFKNRHFNGGFSFTVNRAFRFKNRRTLRFALQKNEIHAGFSAVRASHSQATVAVALAPPTVAHCRKPFIKTKNLWPAKAGIVSDIKHYRGMKPALRPVKAKRFHYFNPEY